MQIITKPEEMQQIIRKIKENEKTVGFVPTMGFLHEGHLSLFKRAKEQADVLVISIFVNPTQFGPNEDFDSYPRDFDHDKHLSEAAGVDYLFYPAAEDMYSQASIMSVKVEERVNVLCGKSRPGHFDGVATVLVKLFNIVTPDYAFFGKKDAQQIAVVDGLINSFLFPITLISCDTLREADGLAKSSRNVKLTLDERREAPIIYKGLQKGNALLRSGVTNYHIIEQTVIDYFKSNLQLGQIDYVSVLTYPELRQHTNVSGKYIIATAIQYSQARLIDNIVATKTP